VAIDFGTQRIEPIGEFRFVVGRTKIDILEFQTNIAVQLNTRANFEGSVLSVIVRIECHCSNATNAVELSIQIANKIRRVGIRLANAAKQVTVDLIIRSLRSRYHQARHQYSQKRFAQHELSPSFVIRAADLAASL